MLGNVGLPVASSLATVAGLSFNETYALLGVLVGFFIWMLKHYQSELKRSREENKALREFMDERMIKEVLKKCRDKDNG